MSALADRTELLIISDTHVTTDPDRVPPAVWDAIDRSDVVIHAGDWVSEILLDAVEARAARLVAVHGNNDGPGLRARLPETVTADIGGLRFRVVHETGPTRGREQRCRAAHHDVDVVVFGHSHIPWDTTVIDGPRLLNPGSPTDRRRQPACTYLTAAVVDGTLGEVVLNRLPARPDPPVAVTPRG